MTALLVHPLDKPLVGGVGVPSDAPIAHRALVLAALAEGTSELRGLWLSEDLVRTVSALRSLGVVIEELSKGLVRVTGKGLFGLASAPGAIACGTSASTLRLLAGALSAQPFGSMLACEPPIATLPLASVVAPLRARGAHVQGRPHAALTGDVTAPIAIAPLVPEEELGELEYDCPVADEDVKGGILLSGLYAHGTTWFKEPSLSPDHLERMMHVLGVPIRTLGTMVELDPAGWDGVMKPFAMTMPGSPPSAAFLVAAAQIFPGSQVTLRGVGTNPTRSGFFDVARQMGAGIAVTPLGDEGGEPVGEVSAWPGAARGTRVGGELVARARGDVAALATLAAKARGTTMLRDLLEGRDAALAVARVLGAFGVTCEELPDGIVVHGREGALEPAVVDSAGDPRLAMAATVLALGAHAPSRIEGVEGLAKLFPRFVGTLRALGARIDVES